MRLRDHPELQLRPVRGHLHETDGWFFEDCHPHTATMQLNEDGVYEIAVDAGAHLFDFDTEGDSVAITYTPPAETSP